jgi:hypothetical protein
VRGRRPIARARARRTHLVLLLPAIALLLERGDRALEGLRVRARGVRVARGLLERREPLLRLLEVRLGHAQLVRERGDVVVALEERLLVRLVLRLGGLGARVRGVRLGAQRREFLRRGS